MVHLVERLYKCNLCSQTYSTKKALDEHIKRHALSIMTCESTSTQQHSSSEVMSPSTPASSSSNTLPEFQITLTNNFGDVGNSCQNSRGTLSGGIHRHQRPADYVPSSSGSQLFGRASSVDQSNVNSIKRLLLSSDCQMKQQQQEQLNDFTNKSTMVNRHHDSIPPLIPITASYSTPMISSVVPSQQHESMNFHKQQVLVDSQEFHEQRNGDFGFYGQPLRKICHSLKAGQEGDDCTSSSNCESDPDVHTFPASPSLQILSAGETIYSSPDVMFCQTLRSTSVIQFAYRLAA